MQKTGVEWTYQQGPWGKQGVMEKVLHVQGVDNRRPLPDVLSDWRIDQTARDGIEQVSKSVACLVLESNCVLTGDPARYQLTPQVPLLKQLRNHRGIQMGEGERFADEPTPGFGTAFLVAPDVLLTAAHCVCKQKTDQLDLQRIGKTLVVFGFTNREGKRPKMKFKPQNVASVAAVIAHKYTTGLHGQDWALLRLQEPVAGRDPLPINFNWKAAVRNPIFMVGHPIGLPMKYTGNAQVQRTSGRHEVLTDLDAFGGNSGSPIFDQQHQVVGILVRGADDFAVDPDYQGTGQQRLVAHVTDNPESETIVRVASLAFVKAFLPSLAVVPGGGSTQYEPGLSLEGECGSEACQGARVIIPYAFGTFNMSKACAQTHCSACQSLIPWENVNTMVLARCHYKLDGQDERQIRIVEEDNLQEGVVFRIDVQTWRFIEVTTSQSKKA